MGEKSPRECDHVYTYCQIAMLRVWWLCSGGKERAERRNDETQAPSQQLSATYAAAGAPLRCYSTIFRQQRTRVPRRPSDFPMRPKRPSPHAVVSSLTCCPPPHLRTSAHRTNAAIIPRVLSSPTRAALHNLPLCPASAAGASRNLSGTQSPHSSSSLPSSSSPST
jgi:hypothetical protein